MQKAGLNPQAFPEIKNQLWTAQVVLSPILKGCDEEISNLGITSTFCITVVSMGHSVV